MIAYTALLLFLIGVFNSFKVSAGFDKVLSFFTFISLVFIFANFCDSEVVGSKEHIFSLAWNSTPGKDIKFDIISNSYNKQIIIPFFALTLLGIFYNLNFRYEESRSTFSSLLVFNLATLIIMVTSNNFVQLLTALFVVDILSVFIIKDSLSYRRYIMLNILADMILFMVLAIINSQVDSLDIRQILRYKQSGMYIDFLAVSGFTAVLIKIGMFGFHIGFADLKNVRLHRLQQILFMSSPLAAIIVLLKFHILWQTSEYFIVYLNAACISTMFWSFYGVVFIDSFKSKIIYLQTMFWALFIELLRFNGFIWNDMLSRLLVAMYLLISSMYLIYYYHNRLPGAYQMGKLTIRKTDIQKYIFFMLWLLIIVMSGILTEIYNNSNRYYIWLFAVMFVLALSSVIQQIYFSEKNIALKSQDLPNKKAVFTTISGLSLFLLYEIDYMALPVFGFAAGFLILCRYFSLSANTELPTSWQTKSPFNTIYKSIISAIRHFGQFIRLFIDKLLIEKVIFSIAMFFSQVFIRIFRRIHNKLLSGGFAVFMLLILLLWLSFNKGEF